MRPRQPPVARLCNYVNKKINPQWYYIGTLFGDRPQYFVVFTVFPVFCRSGHCQNRQKSPRCASRPPTALA